jgi:integrase
MKAAFNPVADAKSAALLSLALPRPRVPPCAWQSASVSDRGGLRLVDRGADAQVRVDTRAIQAWTGHASIVHTTRYTALASDRFKDFWRG